MLTACAAGTVCINTNLIHVDFYLLRVLNLRHYLAAGEGCVAARVGIKRRNTDKAVNTLFGFQISEGIVSTDKESR